MFKQDRYVDLLGWVLDDPVELPHDRDKLFFKIKDHNGLIIHCVSCFQLAHHVRKNDSMLFYGKIIPASIDGTKEYVLLETIHEHQAANIKPDPFLLDGAL